MDDGILEGFLRNLNDVQQNKIPDVYIFSATNCPNDLDPAVAKRFYPIHVVHPNLRTRSSYISSLLQPCVLSKEEIDILAKKCEGSSFYEIKLMISEVVNKKFLHDMNSGFFKLLPDGTYMSCLSSDPQCLKMPSGKVPDHALRGNPMTFSDLKERFDSPICATSEKQHKALKKFKEKYST